MVGVGNIAPLNVAGYLEHERCDVMALCDPRAEVAERRAREREVPHVYTGMDDLLTDGEVDAVEILWPTHPHIRGPSARRTVGGARVRANTGRAPEPITGWISHADLRGSRSGRGAGSAAVRPRRRHCGRSQGRRARRGTRGGHGGSVAGVWTRCGPRARPGLPRSLADQLSRAGATPELQTRDSIAEWISASPTRRGQVLRDLLGLADRLPPPKRTRLKFPGLRAVSPSDG